MIRLHFTPPVGNLTWDDWVREGKEAAARMLADKTDEHIIDEALYKRQRDRFLAATHRKCAYCELGLPPGQRKGDVEHYRPKGRARRLDGKIVKVQRDGVMIDHPGYYWLAYDYLNLLPACLACNRRASDAATGTNTGKSDIFPTLNDRWATCPEDVASEQPALLNPWLDDPAEHLCFDPDTGLVIGTTERGRVTECVLGLNRDGLPEARKKACRNVRRALRVVIGDVIYHHADLEDLDQLKSVRDGSAEYAAICQVEYERGLQKIQDFIAILDRGAQQAIP